MMIFDLELRAPLHVGEFVGIDREAVQSHIPSDTLFAALVMAWRALPDANALSARLAACKATEPALWLTSAFPRAGQVRFYPMPLGLRLNAGDDALSAKQRKRVRWVSQELFDKLLTFQDVRAECEPQANFAQGATVWLTKRERESLVQLLHSTGDDLTLWREQIVPHVTVDRHGDASNLHHSGRLSFVPGCGLWLGAQGSGAAWVKDGLDLLRDSGIGGLRSTGHGAFTYTSTQRADLQRPARGYGVCLSRYAPRNASEIASALQAPGSAYALVLVGGWCQDDAGKAWRRKSTRLIAEGACLGAAARGGLVDVHPEGVMVRPVYRYGLAFCAPVSEAALLPAPAGATREI